MMDWSIPNKESPPIINKIERVKSYLPTSTVGNKLVKNRVSVKNNSTPPIRNKNTLILLFTNPSFKNDIALFFNKFKFCVSC